MIEPTEHEIDKAHRRASYQRRYSAHLSAHHDCRDPDHPGCELCDGSMDEEDEEEAEDDDLPEGEQSDA